MSPRVAHLTGGSKHSSSLAPTETACEQVLRTGIITRRQGNCAPAPYRSRTYSQPAAENRPVNPDQIIATCRQHQTSPFSGSLHSDNTHLTGKPYCVYIGAISEITRPPH